MALATLQDMISFYGEDYILKLTDRTRSGVIDVALVTAELEQAEEELMTGLYDRVVIGDTAPSYVKRHICNIAVHNIASMGATAMSQNKKYNYERAMKWRQSVIDGAAQVRQGDVNETTEAEVVGDVTEQTMSITKLIEGL